MARNERCSAGVLVVQVRAAGSVRVGGGHYLGWRQCRAEFPPPKKELFAGTYQGGYWPFNGLWSRQTRPPSPAPSRKHSPAPLTLSSASSAGGTVVAGSCRSTPSSAGRAVLAAWLVVSVDAMAWSRASNPGKAWDAMFGGYLASPLPTLGRLACFAAARGCAGVIFLQMALAE